MRSKGQGAAPAGVISGYYLWWKRKHRAA